MPFSLRSRTRVIIPEVVQTSGMDCGPAALKCLLEGFGIRASYGRLREACQTSIDGTSIDTLEEIAVQLGLAAEQIMLPVDHFFLPEAKTLPALVATVEPNGLTHFVVAWNRIGPWVQVMDPARGRRWLTSRSFTRELYVHRMAVPAGAWREWAGSRDFLSGLGRRLRRLGVKRDDARGLIQAALCEKSWLPLASLDSATRMVQSVASAAAIRKGKQTSRLLKALVMRQREKSVPSEAIPERYWSVRPVEQPNAGEKEEQLLFQGAVMVRARSAARVAAQASEVDRDPGLTGPDQGGLPRELKAALEERPISPLREFFRLLKQDGILSPISVLSSICLAGLAVVVQALLLDGFLSLAGQIGPPEYRLAAVFLLIVFLAFEIGLDLSIARGTLDFGRRLELRLRVAFLSKIPRLPDAYFRSRPSSDMAERCHSAHTLRDTPDIGARLSRNLFELLFTTAGIIWLDPALAPIASITAVVSVLFPLSATPTMSELDLRVRSHAGAMGRFYLDALLGLVPIRAHGAERSVRREHEALVSEWAASGYRLHRTGAVLDSAQCLIAYGLIALLIFKHLTGAGGASGMLLLVYWALNLEVLGDLIVLAIRRYPGQRSGILRLIEPLGAPEQGAEVAGSEGPMPGGGSGPGLRMAHSIKSPGKSPGKDPGRNGSGAASGYQARGTTNQNKHPVGVAVAMRDVRIVAAGHTILDEINLDIDPGEHIAIVGPSGAGKSSLAGTLLGWHRAESGEIRTDGQPLSETRLIELRKHIAWVDPAVQLWNRSLMENVSYGTNTHTAAGIGFAQVVDTADLRDLLESLPEGLQTRLGESGALVSGGEGQRVRFARALRRDSVRLAILDEPFRGLDRIQRRRLLGRARELWKDSTLLCITHDLAETLAFERVVVVQSGRIIEDGNPAILAGRVDSSYRAMLDAEEEVHDRFRSSTDWRRVRIDNAQLVEEALDEVAT
ncbi:MAG TPA: ATP-binding cassette domain-containing protein [Blastocatellia bacterium]|nr:ATP-binding cassette domain-containing protein [Blastocatellia bacterium]